MMTSAQRIISEKNGSPVHPAVQKPFLFFQPKLTINQPNDSYEQEANAMADRVMKMPGKNDSAPSFFKPAISQIQKKCSHCEEEEKVQLKGESDTSAGIIAPPLVHDVISSGGHSMDDGTRSFMEQRFGYDFKNVQIHNDSKAHQSSAEINALAYTHGNHVVFAQQKYKPDSIDGKQLLAHELTHVIQQQTSAGKVQRKTDCRDGSFRTETYVSVANENDYAIVDGYSTLKGTIYDILSDGRQKFFCYGEKKIYVRFNERELVPDLKPQMEEKYKIKIEKDTKDWSQHDLVLLAEALATLTPGEAALLHDYPFVREDGHFTLSDDGDYAVAITTNDIVHNDYMIQFWDDCFSGGGDVTTVPIANLSKGVYCIIHELGHVLEFGRKKPLNVALYDLDTFVKVYDKASAQKKKEMAAKLKELQAAYDTASTAWKNKQTVEDQFDKLTKGKPALTAYSKKNEDEAFAEAFALFKANPGWLRKKNKKLFDYFTKGGFL